MLNKGFGFAFVAAMGLALLVPEPGERAAAQVAKGKTRPAATKYLMRGITQPNCKGLAELLKDPGPAEDKAWDTALCHASNLNEMSFLLMDDGRCPDGTWAGAAKALREASAAVIDAAGKKDLAGTKTAFKGVTDSCKTCHDAHKKK